MTERIDKSLTADTAEVVRCSRCKNYENINNEHYCGEYGGRIAENDFCSRAVPKGKEGKQK